MKNKPEFWERARISGKYGGPWYDGIIFKDMIFLFDPAGRMAAVEFFEKSSRHYIMRHFGGKEVLYEFNNHELQRKYGFLPYEFVVSISEDVHLLPKYSERARDGLSELTKVLKTGYNKFKKDPPFSIDEIIEHPPDVLDLEQNKFDEIMSSRITVLPPDLYYDEYRTTPVIIAEGCGGICNFCDFYEDRTLRKVSIDRVDKQIDSLIKHFGNSLPFYPIIFLAQGNTFALSTDYLFKVTDKVKSVLRFNLSFILFSTVGALNEKNTDELKALKEAGYQINVGLESGYDPLLDESNKGHTAEEVKYAITKAREADLYCSLNVILGLGGRKYLIEHPKATRRLLEETNYRGNVYVSPLKYNNGSILDWEPLTQEEMTLQRRIIAGKNDNVLREYVFIDLN